MKYLSQVDLRKATADKSHDEVTDLYLQAYDMLVRVTRQAGCMYGGPAGEEPCSCAACKAHDVLIQHEKEHA